LIFKERAEKMESRDQRRESRAEEDGVERPGSSGRELEEEGVERPASRVEGRRRWSRETSVERSRAAEEMLAGGWSMNVLTSE
jgi:hypothetical protein